MPDSPRMDWLERALLNLVQDSHLVKINVHISIQRTLLARLFAYYPEIEGFIRAIGRINCNRLFRRVNEVDC